MNRFEDNTIYDIMIKGVKKILLGIKSGLIFILLKLRYFNRIKLFLVNSIKGKLKIEIFQTAHLSIGRFFMTAGPCYIKCIGNARWCIGDRVFLNHNCSITCAERIVIGNYCNIANNVVIVDHNHKVEKHGVVDGLESQPIVIGNNVWIGANATILQGVTIGDGAVVAAGAVVNRDIPSCQVWGGIPAKCIKNLND